MTSGGNGVAASAGNDDRSSSDAPSSNDETNTSVESSSDDDDNDNARRRQRQLKRVPTTGRVYDYALCFVGSLLDFGLSDSGAVDASGRPRVREVAVQFDAPITSVSCGVDSVCLLTASGRAYSCGLDTYGQLGQGGSRARDTIEQRRQQGCAATGAALLVPRPLQCPFEHKIVRIACGTSHGGFVVERGALFMFGCTSYGRLGIGDVAADARARTSEAQHAPVQVRMRWSVLQRKVTQTSAAESSGVPVIHHKPIEFVTRPSSNSSSAAVSPAGGSESDERAARDTYTNDNDDDVVFTDISCGDRHTLVLGAKASSASSSSTNSSKLSVISFGDGMNGRLGIGSERDQYTGALVATSSAPQHLHTKRAALPPIVAIAAGGSHSAALSASGELFTWGNGVAGQLGHGTRESEWLPRSVELFQTMALASVKCGAHHMLAVTRMGVVFTWGRSAEGQCGTGDAGLDTSDAAVSSAALLPQQVRLVVDPLAVQQMSIDAHVQAAAAAATGALTSTLLAASQHQQQQLQHDLKVTVRAIAARANVCMALDDYARLFAWGDNCSQQLGVATTKDRPPLERARRRSSLVARKRSLTISESSTEATTQAARSHPQPPVGIVSIPQQVLYMNLQTIAVATGSSSSDATAPSTRKALVHFAASDRFSLLVFTIDRTAPTSSSSNHVNSLHSVGRSEPAAPPASVIQPHCSSSDTSKAATDASGSRTTTWHLSLFDNVDGNDGPSREQTYFQLFSSYRVSIPRSLPPSASLDCAMSTRWPTDVDACDYDVGERLRPISAAPTAASASSSTYRRAQSARNAPMTAASLQLLQPSTSRDVRGVAAWLEKHASSAATCVRPRCTVDRITAATTKSDNVQSATVAMVSAATNTQRPHSRMNSHAIASQQQQQPVRPQTAASKSQSRLHPTHIATGSATQRHTQQRHRPQSAAIAPAPATARGATSSPRRPAPKAAPTRQQATRSVD